MPVWLRVREMHTQCNPCACLERVLVGGIAYIHTSYIHYMAKISFCLFFVLFFCFVFRTNSAWCAGSRVRPCAFVSLVLSSMRGIGAPLLAAAAVAGGCREVWGGPVMACPPNSVQQGNSCVCAAGHSPSASGTSCIIGLIGNFEYVHFAQCCLCACCLLLSSVCKSCIACLLFEAHARTHAPASATSIATHGTYFLCVACFTLGIFQVCCGTG